MYISTCMYTHTHRHTYATQHIYAYVHTCTITRVCIYTDTHTCTHTNTDRHTHTHNWTHTQTDTNTHTHTYIHSASSHNTYTLFPSPPNTNTIITQRVEISDSFINYLYHSEKDHWFIVLTNSLHWPCHEEIVSAVCFLPQLVVWHGTVPCTWNVPPCHKPLNPSPSDGVSHSC